MSSKADDFDLRYRDVHNGDSGRHGDDGHASGGYGDVGYANGGYEAPRGNGSTVDYDLGYDAQGWDTQGFRRPEAGYPGHQATDHLDVDPSAAPPRNGRTGTHARATGVREAGPPTRGAGGPGRRAAWVPGGPDRFGRRFGPGGPGTRRPRVKVKGSWWRHWTPRKVLGVLLGVVGGFMVLGAILVAVAYEETQVPTQAMAETEYAQSLVYSSNGTLIGRFGTTDRQMLTLDQIPPNLINAVLAAEDRHFWTEGGISLTATLRAAFTDLRGGSALQGGSTITQQFVRNYYQGIGTAQTLTRKIKEIFVAMKIAKEKSKQWILENYLNTIFLGEGSYGIQAAAETYFGRPVSELSVAQDAVIAALIQQPSTYPLPQYRPELVARWRYVLDGMVQMGKLSPQAAATMKFPKFEANAPQSFGPNVWDPYILNMVYNELTQVYHFTQAQIYYGGYIIKTTIDDKKMAALYQAVIQNEAQINASSVPFQGYMHVGAVLEDPATGAIQALYPGPGYPGARYNGTGRIITSSECKKIDCEVNMAVYNREQVGSSFKPYILATAVKEGMNVKTSTLDGFDPLYIPLDSNPGAFATSNQADALPGSHIVNNDSPAENGPYTPQVAMAASINTAYSDLWHVVAGVGSQTKANNVGTMAQLFGVDTAAAGITGPLDFQDQYGVTLGEASLTVGEQATMLATLADNGVYHDAHVIASISRNNVQTPLMITTYQVFSPSPTLNAEEDSQVQYAMSEDTAPYGTAPGAAMSNGQQIIAKTGTTEDAQSAFFIGAMPTQALAVAIFTSNQSGKCPPAPAVCQTLNGLGGLAQGGYGGTWPATIWHTYAENQFIQLGIENFQQAVFTGTAWNEVPPNLRKHPKKHHPDQNNPNPNPSPTGNPGNPNPYPTFSCDPSLVTCSTQTPLQFNGGGGGAGHAQPATAAGAGAAVGGVFAAVPVTGLWVRRRMRKRGAGRG